MSVVGAIALIGLCISVPLLTMGILNGDITLIPNIFQTPQLNVKCKETIDIRSKIIHLLFTQNNGVLENKYTFLCGNSTFLQADLVLSIIVYRGGLHIFGLVLAFLTWNIKVDFRNEYHYNAAIIVSSSALFLTWFSPILLVDYPTLLGFIAAFNYFLASTLYLGLTFIPKVLTGINM